MLSDNACGDAATAADRVVGPAWPGHAHAVFGISVIGVAEAAFATVSHAIPVLRGSSARPLFVTATGMSRAGAAELVRVMAGRFRVPGALRCGPASPHRPVGNCPEGPSPRLIGDVARLGTYGMRGIGWAARRRQQWRPWSSRP
jgi:hypothetical protein